VLYVQLFVLKLFYSVMCPVICFKIVFIVLYVWLFVLKLFYSVMCPGICFKIVL